MSLLKNFIQDFAKSGQNTLHKSHVPQELRLPGGPFYGADSAHIFSTIRTILDTKDTRLLQNEEALREFAKFCLTESKKSIYTFLLRRSAKCKLFQLTDSEFDCIKNKFPQVVRGQNKQDFINKANADLNAFKLFAYSLSLYSSIKVSYNIETKLYNYLHTLISASDISENDTIEIDDIILGDTSALEEVLTDLKTTQRTSKSGVQIPLLHSSVSVNELRDSIVKAINSFSLRASINPGKIVKIEKGILQDLGELSLQNYIVIQLNEAKQKQQELNQDEILVQFLDECRKAKSLSEVSKTPIPEELKKFGKIFHGLKDVTIYSVLVKLIKLDKQNSKSDSVANDYDIDAIYDIIEMQILKLQNDIVHNLIIRISTSKVFQITDIEFEALKQDERFILLDTKEEFCQKVKANPKSIMDKLAQLIYRNEAEERTSESASSPLYRFVLRLVANKNSTKPDSLEIHQVLLDLRTSERKTKDGKPISKLKHEYVSESSFLEVVENFIKDHKLEISITNERLVRYENGEIKDLGELTLQNYVVKQLNELKASSGIDIDILSYTSLHNGKNSNSKEPSVNMSQADATKALNKADEHGASLI